MPAYAVGERVKQYRPFFLFQNFFFPFESVYNGQGVVSVDAFSLHHIRIYSCSNPGQGFKSHGFSFGLSPHTVLVVHEVEYDGHASLVITRP